MLLATYKITLPRVYTNSVRKSTQLSQLDDDRIMLTLFVLCFLCDLHMSNALQCTTESLMIIMHHICVLCSAENCFFFFHAVTDGGWVAHFFALSPLPAKEYIVH